MKKLAILVGTFVTFSTCAAGGGPTNIGDLYIGMSKTEYLLAIGTTLPDCSKVKDQNGNTNRADLRDLSPAKRSLCSNYKYLKSGSVENIQIGSISYDVVKVWSETSKTIASLGTNSEAIFLKDRLISIKIYNPRISLETLTAKYGLPKQVDSRKVQICQNQIGNRFENTVGNLDAVWSNGEVNATFRVERNPPVRTCTDGYSFTAYILAESKQLELIDAAINNVRAEIAAAKESSSF